MPKLLYRRKWTKAKMWRQKRESWTLLKKRYNRPWWGNRLSVSYAYLPGRLERAFARRTCWACLLWMTVFYRPLFHFAPQQQIQMVNSINLVDLLFYQQVQSILLDSYNKFKLTNIKEGDENDTIIRNCIIYFNNRWCNLIILWK